MYTPILLVLPAVLLCFLAPGLLLLPALRCHQSISLSTLEEFCLAHSGLLEGKSVLELGAGIGMTGMAVAASCGAREVVLTDYAPK